jgi:formylglycine-generating enzyme required for sulfatase activity
MEIYEVSYAQYLTFMNELGPGSHRNGCDGQPCMQTQNESETSNVTFDSANYSVPSVINDFPMVNVTWYGAKAYCEAIGRRLPTEAEWERAARGDTGFVYPWGDTWDATRASTNRPDGGGEPQKVAVSAFPTGASPFGILNMAGNVAEWTSDWYDARFYSRPEAAGLDPRGPVSGTEKVVRGGSWDAVPFFARTAHRQSRQPLDPTAWIGFRCVEDINAVAPVNAPIGADVAPSLSTPDPALLGVPGAADEETTANSAPTLPPAPTRPVEATQSGPAPTLAPGG